MLPCLFKTLFGFDCLGCGFQRAIFLLFKGKFSDAFEMYPALYSLLIFLVVLIFHFSDRSKNYQKSLWIFGTINLFFMIGGYYYKHFYI
ncbi:DUF2752 domain-containing protein [Flavobacterium sp. FlaQc-57]|uniref:DUF2752 domain-containing protein n=1 Tax=Flavobacterium sp. FlaQc-57 TaxID=3374186 RepID=UPI0037567784